MLLACLNPDLVARHGIMLTAAIAAEVSHQVDGVAGPL